MQDIIFDKPYTFTPPHHGNWWPRVLGLLLERQLHKQYGVESITCLGTEHLTQSLKAGHGVLLAPNHCRPCDPHVLGVLSRRVGQPVFVMASAHLFVESRFKTWLLRRCGAFSVYREGMDKAAVDAAIDILEHARRPLVIFPEGVISRTNDQLNPLMDGTAMIARTAAKRRAKGDATGAPPKVVIHPVAIRYHFHGDIEATVKPLLSEIEARLSWLPQTDLPLVQRVYKVGQALLSLKEMEYLSEARQGPVRERVAHLIDRVLGPLEERWLKSAQPGGVVARVKRLRGAILPDMIKGDLDERERERRWRDLAVCYYAQQMSFYPPDYVRNDTPPERLLETVERFEEDLTDVARIHRPMSATVTVGAAIEVSAARQRGTGDAVGDPLMQRTAAVLRELLGIEGY
ncbi:MAG: 1-acyl-sn-glycerol-3-phosphate acyltransferase [Phycisphaeraceae bacterium]